MGNPKPIILLKEYKNKMIPRTFCYTQRSVSCQAIIREASSSSRWEYIQRPTARVRDFKTLSPEQNVSISSSLSMLRTFQKIIWGDGENQEKNKGFLNKAGWTYIQSHKDCGSVSSSCMCLSEMMSKHQQGKWKQTPSPNPKLSPVNNQ